MKHRHCTAPLAGDAVELDVGKLNAPNGTRVEARASSKRAIPVGLPMGLAVPANRPTCATLAARPQRSGHYEQTLFCWT